MSARCTEVAVHVDGELCHCYYDADHAEKHGHDCGHPEHLRWHAATVTIPAAEEDTNG